jgi:hypothetical protein
MLAMHKRGLIGAAVYAPCKALTWSLAKALSTSPTGVLKKNNMGALRTRWKRLLCRLVLALMDQTLKTESRHISSAKNMSTRPMYTRR